MSSGLLDTASIAYLAICFILGTLLICLLVVLIRLVKNLDYYVRLKTRALEKTSRGVGGIQP